MAGFAKSSGSWSNKDISRAIADDCRCNRQLADQIFESSLRCFDLPCSDEDQGTQCMKAHGDDARLRSRATKFLARVSSIRHQALSSLATLTNKNLPHPRPVRVRIFSAFA